ncbi:glycosyltransferase [Jeotgalibaca sp. A122]|uniref:glycosyltransferase n=1 Tax=Jeotgalibaca sp. A122 TaxID=3457322 RepID=UPI003FD20BE1
MKRILIINTVLFGYNGITNVLMNYYEAMDKSELCIDFIATNRKGITIDNNIRKRFAGANIIELSHRKKQTLRYLKELSEVMKSGYDVVHVNGNSATMALELRMAQKYKIPIRIAHSHSCDEGKFHKIFKYIFKHSYTKAVACSDVAGDWIYGKDNFLVLNNAIDLDKYEYNETSRDEYRKMLGLQDQFVVGHVGLFNNGKNQTFLLDVFYEIKKIKPNSVLLLISGSEKAPEELVNKIELLGLRDDVKILCRRDDIAYLMQAMDIFVFPSKWEGLGLALIEAQAASLPSIASAVVPEVANVADDLVKYISLDEHPSVWAQECLTINTNLRGDNINQIKSKIKKSGYDIKYNAEFLKDIYMTEG